MFSTSLYDHFDDAYPQNGEPINCPTLNAATTPPRKARDPPMDCRYGHCVLIMMEKPDNVGGYVQVMMCV
jgi:hypothetical protein